MNDDFEPSPPAASPRPSRSCSSWRSPASALAAGKVADVAAVRQATLKYHDISAAIADGYVAFYLCTEQPGVGTMGQHFVKLRLLGDPAIDPLQPEVLVYAADAQRRLNAWSPSST